MNTTTNPGLEKTSLDAPSFAQKAEKKSGKRIGYHYIIIKSLKESQKNDVVKCLYIKSVTDFGFCVIKEGSSGDSKDKHGRDIKDRLAWQKALHAKLQDKIRLPKLLGSFEENGNYYLVIEHIKGKALNKLANEKRKELRKALRDSSHLGIIFTGYLVQITDILEVLHHQSIVHRDATVNNFIVTPNGKVAVIDMELSYSIDDAFPSPPFMLGTNGFMSPQQEATQTPTRSEDIFAIGSIILQLWSGISAGKLTNDPHYLLQERTRFLIPDRYIADIVEACLHPEAEKRPALKDIREALLQYIRDGNAKIKRVSCSPVIYTRSDMENVIQEFIQTLASPMLTDPEKGWFSNELYTDVPEDKKRINKAWYAGFGYGASGIIYTMSLMKSAGYDTDVLLPHVTSGLQLIKERYINRIDQTKASLYFGASGIAATLSAAIENAVVPFEYQEWIIPLLTRETNHINFENGIAGQTLSIMACRDHIPAIFMEEQLKKHVRALAEKQEFDGSWVSRIDKKGRKRVRRGFADGMSGIICVLLEYGRHYDDTISIHAAQKGLDWMMENKHAIKRNWWQPPKKKKPNNWLAGGDSGIALAFIKGYDVTGQEKYKAYATGLLNNIQPDLLSNNLGQTYGLSGLGEVYLEAYKAFKEDKWIRRADWIAQTMMQLRKIHTRHGIYWLVENERLPVGAFLTGNSGVIHFLLRYCHMDKVSFPLIPASKERYTSIRKMKI